MKKVLSLLVTFVFLQVETWALSGGPQYGGNQGSLGGTYAGVLTGVKDTVVPIVGAAVVASGSNSLGLFVIGVPTTDLAQGTIALFAEGIFYQGGVLGIADPNKSKLSGVAQMIHATSVTSTTDQFFGTTNSSLTYDSQADGTISAKINGSSTTASVGGVTFKGKGTFTVSNLRETPVTTTTTSNTIPPVTTTSTTIINTFVPSGTISFKLDGFKQSATVVLPKAGSTAALLNGQASGANGF